MPGLGEVRGQGRATTVVRIDAELAGSLIHRPKAHVHLACSCEGIAVAEAPTPKLALALTASGLTKDAEVSKIAEAEAPASWVLGLATRWLVAC